jgi:hypothetical protein
MSKALRQLATIVNYDELHLAFRARAQELQISRLSIDCLGDLADGHASKIVGLGKIRRMGLSALRPMCRALAIKILIIEDPEQLAQCRTCGASPRKLRPSSGKPATE